MTDDPPPSVKTELKGAAKLLGWIVGILLVLSVPALILVWSGCVPRPH